MKSFIFAMIAVVASSFATVQAGYLPAGSASFNAASGSLSGGANTNTAFTFNTGAVTNSPSAPTGSFAGDTGVTWGSFNVPAFGSGANFSFSITGDFGSFSGSTISHTYAGDNDTNVRSMLATGTFTRTGFDATPASIAFSVTETGASYSYAFTFSVSPPPPAAVPEPASMAIFGLGALGMAARRYRRK